MSPHCHCHSVNRKSRAGIHLGLCFSSEHSPFMRLFAWAPAFASAESSVLVCVIAQRKVCVSASSLYFCVINPSLSVSFYPSGCIFSDVHPFTRPFSFSFGVSVFLPTFRESPSPMMSPGIQIFHVLHPLSSVVHLFASTAPLNGCILLDLVVVARFKFFPLYTFAEHS